MESDSSSLARILIIAVSVIVVVGYIVLKWKRASRYVDERNEMYAALREREHAYTERAKHDSRWSVFYGHRLIQIGITAGNAH